MDGVYSIKTDGEESMREAITWNGMTIYKSTWLWEYKSIKYR